MSTIKAINPAESYIKQQLRSLGYYNIQIKSENASENSFDLIALGNLRNIYLMVKIVTTPHKTFRLSSKVKDEIKENAEKFDKEPWAALVEVNPSQEIVNNVMWEMV